MRKLISILGNILSALVLILFLVGGSFLLASKALHRQGGYQVFSVRSGSMTPTLPVGSLLIVHAKASYAPGDIVTFSDGGQVITHRIFAEVPGGFQTKGDANQNPDDSIRKADSIIGQVYYMIPWLGYPLTYSHTYIGYLLFILLPALVLMLREVVVIGKELDKPRKAPQIALLILALLVLPVHTTAAYFSTSTTNRGNHFQAASDFLAGTTQYGSGNIDYAHGMFEGDTLQGYYNGLYQVELSNEGVVEFGSKNNGLFVTRQNDQDIPPLLDPDLTLLNGVSLTTYIEGDFPEPSVGANPIVFTVRLHGLRDPKLGRHDSDFDNGDGGNVFVKLHYLSE